ncbi:MAG: hypothetical protein IJF61_02545 [Clostridia bacterium]|nr:hypothetical protein [Clostridia bacterium]
MQNRIYIVDCRYFDAVSASFGTGRILLPSVPCKELDEPVSCHPDMVLFAPEKGTLICAKEVFEDYQKLLSPYGVRLVQGKSNLMRDYPKDIAYNVLYTSVGAFARFDSTDARVTDFLEKQKVQKHNVNQGYARCSTVSFGAAVITADTTISEAGKAAGLSVLKINSGFVSLPGYDYGFLGGASGVLEDNTVAFFGDLSTHPDGEKIRRFISENGYVCSDVPGTPLLDIGTIFCIEL